jgi:hypothetical protein
MDIHLKVQAMAICMILFRLRIRRHNLILSQCLTPEFRLPSLVHGTHYVSQRLSGRVSVSY